MVELGTIKFLTQQFNNGVDKLQDVKLQDLTLDDVNKGIAKLRVILQKYSPPQDATPPVSQEQVVRLRNDLDELGKSVAQAAKKGADQIPVELAQKLSVLTAAISPVVALVSGAAAAGLAAKHADTLAPSVNQKANANPAKKTATGPSAGALAPPRPVGASLGDCPPPKTERERNPNRYLGATEAQQTELWKMDSESGWKAFRLLRDESTGFPGIEIDYFNAGNNWVDFRIDAKFAHWLGQLADEVKLDLVWTDEKAGTGTLIDRDNG